jgi:hypothetical protein
MVGLKTMRKIDVASVNTVYFAFSSEKLPETIIGFACHHFGNFGENRRNTPGLRG